VAGFPCFQAKQREIPFVMQSMIRKHKQALAIFIFVVIGIPMVFFGVPEFWNSPNSRQEVSIGKVGDVPLKAQDFTQMLAPFRNRTGPDGQETTFASLEADGTVDKIIGRMIDGAVITNVDQQRKFDVDKSLLESQLKEFSDFKDEQGNFDAKLWNQWVESPTVNWNEIYERVRESVSRQVFMDMALAPAGRVLEADITKELEKKSTAMRVKYYKVDPGVTPTEEQIKATYDKEVAKTDGKPKYKKPDQYVIDYVALSLQAPVPALATDLVKQAREGSDFAALADANSMLKAKNGGEMGGWQRERENESEQRKPLFALKPGEVSEPVASALGYYIYKVDEERTAEDGVREVKARQILIEAKLSDEEKTAVLAKANEISEKAKSVGLAKAVEELNAAGATFEIKRTPTFDRESTEIEGIARIDLAKFRSAFETLDVGTKLTVIESAQHNFVAEVAEKIDGPVPPLEEIREKVLEDTVRALKGEEPYLGQVKEAADKIKAQVANIDEIPTKFPDLKGTVGESEEFKVSDFIVKIPATATTTDRPFIPSDKVYDLLNGKAAGAFAGPLSGFGGGDAYFVQLIEMKPPTEEDKKTWDAQRKEIRDQRVNQAKNQLMEDLTKDLTASTITTLGFERDEEMIGQLLDRGNRTAPATEAPATGAPAAAAPTESAPAADAATK